MYRLRRSLKRKIVSAAVWGISVVVIMLGSIWFSGRRMQRKYLPLLEQRDQVINNAKRTVFVTTKDIACGEGLNSDNCIMRVVLSDEAQEEFCSDLLGTIARTALPAGIFVKECQCTRAKFGDTEREVISEDIGGCDRFDDFACVDVRIRYPNGENYCVLSKKRLRKSEDEVKESRLTLSEKEQILLSYALYDKEIFEGTELYFVAYREESLQEQSASGYVPSVEGIDQLMKMSESEGCAEASWYVRRVELEKRLYENEEEKRRERYY